MSEELDDFYQGIDDFLKVKKDLALKNKVDFESEFIKFHNYLLDNSKKLSDYPKTVLKNFDLQIQFFLLEYNTQPQTKRKRLQFEWIRIKEMNLIIRGLIGKNLINPFPDIFRGDDDKSFNLFKEFIEKHYLDPYTDFSFIFQHMKKDGYIFDIKHRFFMEWLLKNSFIGEEDFQKFMDKLNFRAYKKLNDATRLNSYIKIKESLFQ